MLIAKVASCSECCIQTFTESREKEKMHHAATGTTAALRGLSVQNPFKKDQVGVSAWRATIDRYNSFANQRAWKKSGEGHNPCAWSPVWMLPESVMIRCHVVCGCCSTGFSEVHSWHSQLPENFRALHASSCWQALWSCWFNFPAEPGTCPHLTGVYQKLVHWPWCYRASKQAWPKAHQESMGSHQYEKHQTQQCRWIVCNEYVQWGFKMRV